MYKDIIHYELADNISKEHLISVATQIVTDWMKQLPGFIKWEIHTNNEGHLTDIVYWESKEAAKKAEKAMADIPNVSDWMACYKQGSISSKKLVKIAQLGA